MSAVQLMMYCLRSCVCRSPGASGRPVDGYSEQVKRHQFLRLGYFHAFFLSVSFSGQKYIKFSFYIIPRSWQVITSVAERGPGGRTVSDSSSRRGAGQSEVSVCDEDCGEIPLHL